MRRLALLLVLTAGCTPSLAPEDSSTDALGGARMDYTRKGVLALRAGTDDATAILVAPRIVITAAHAVDPYYVGPRDYVGVAVTDKVDDDTFFTPIHAAKIHEHPSYVAGHTALGHDIAVLELEDDLDVAQLNLSTTPLDTSVLQSSVRIVGYGTYRTSKQSGESRLTATTVVHGAMDQVLLVGGGHDESQACSGDSGGPVLRTTAGGEEIIALASYLSAGDTRCANGNYSTRIDVNLDFLTTYLPDLIPPTDGNQ